MLKAFATALVKGLKKQKKQKAKRKGNNENMKKIKKAITGLVLIATLGGSAYVALANGGGGYLYGQSCYAYANCCDGGLALSVKPCAAPYCCYGVWNDGCQNGGYCYAVTYCGPCPWG